MHASMLLFDCSCNALVLHNTFGDSHPAVNNPKSVNTADKTTRKAKFSAASLCMNNNVDISMHACVRQMRPRSTVIH